MHAMILAAGRGERMRPLTDHCPKPLLPVGGKPLIVWHLERLQRAGFAGVVINHAHLGAQIEALLGDGSAWHLSIRYSPEPPGALETAGGIRLALPHLSDPFLVVNGDIFCDWDFARARNGLVPDDLAHLVLAANPPHHPQGDFNLEENRVHPPAARNPQPATRTYTGIGIYRHALFDPLTPGQPAKLAPLLHAAIEEGRVSGEAHTGAWTDVGTPQRLRALDEALSHPSHQR